MNENKKTKDMLRVLRKPIHEKHDKLAKDFAPQTNVFKDNYYRISRILMEEAVMEQNGNKRTLNEDEDVDESHSDSVVIKKTTPQFGDVRTSQEDMIRKAVNDNVKFSDDALRYYPKADDLTLNGEIPSLNLKFQFRFSDPSGDGLYIWCESMQLTETNARTIGKIRDAFSNWRNSIVQDNDFMEKLKNMVNNNK